MLELDFVYWHMRSSARRGPAVSKALLDRLAPFLWAPRLEHLIRLEPLALQGGDMRLPLDTKAWSLLAEEQRQQLWRRGERLLEEFQLPVLALDRRLRNIAEPFNNDARLFCYGDHFIIALALSLTAQALRKHRIQRITVVMIEEHALLAELLLRLNQHGLVISLQSSRPARQESMIYRLLYRQGAAITNQLIVPSSWDSRTLVLQLGGLPLPVAGPHISLNDYSEGLAPSLEQGLMKAGVDGRLYALAPILETCLWQSYYRDIEYSENANWLDILLNYGESSDMWKAFLDNS